MISVEEANRRADRVAAASRKQAEESLDAYKAEIAPKLSQLDGLLKEREETAKGKQTREQQLEGEITDLRGQLSERDTALANARATLAEVARIRRREQVDGAITAAVGEGVTTAQRDLIQQQFAAVEELDVAQVTAAAEAARAEVERQLQVLGYAKPAVQIGSPGAPPAEQQPDSLAELEELDKRIAAGDADALAEAQRRLNVR